MPQTVVVATRNPGKVVELRRLLDGLPLTLISLDEAGVAEELAETGTTFADNARQKAERARDLTGLPALADDSGICVDALDGAPGVYSARYGGPGLDDRGRVQRLLADLAGVPEERRSARFVAVIAFAAPDRATLTTEGVVEGVVAAAPAGDGGFGYDPVFFVPALGLTTAQLPSHVKNQISHRGQAVRAMRPLLAELFRDA